MMLDQQFFVTEDLAVDGPSRASSSATASTRRRCAGRTTRRSRCRSSSTTRRAPRRRSRWATARTTSSTSCRSTLEGQRDLAVESMYEYGSRAGIWRLFRVFDARRHPGDVLRGRRRARAQPRGGRRSSRARGDEAAGHGYRWSNHFEMTRDEEREAIRRAVESIERTTGTRPLGWYCREMSVNTRELVVEEGGFVYDSDCYNDDLPYWTRVLGRPHLVVPYGLVVNDARYVSGDGLRRAPTLLRHREGASRPAAQRRRRRVADDVDRPASADHRQPGARGRARALHRVRASARRRLVRAPHRHRELVRRAAAERDVAGPGRGRVNGRGTPLP